MHVLLTNDDGIRAPGLQALHAALLDADRLQVEVVAPLTVQSATGHGVTFDEPLMVRRERVSDRLTGDAVDGRPADCVKLAICELWPDRFGAGSRPDLVVSGLNAGANIGVNVIYSGTVAAAIEAAFLGVPSVAVSLHLGTGRARFDVAARHAHEVLARLLAAGLEPHDCINVNLPITEQDGPLPPIRLCPMNVHGQVDQYERRVSPRGEVYYWAAGNGMEFRDTDAGSDVRELLRRHITITPLTYDLTRHPSLDRWREHLGAP